jgi:hypothetical protein
MKNFGMAGENNTPDCHIRHVFAATQTTETVFSAALNLTAKGAESSRRAISPPECAGHLSTFQRCEASD